MSDESDKPEQESSWPQADADGVVRFTLSFRVPEGSDPSDPYSMIGAIDLDAHLADELGATLDEQEQAERFAQYGEPGDRD